jgi:hypothetical protein
MNVKRIIRLFLATAMLVGTCTVASADGTDPPPCQPGTPGCPNPKVVRVSVPDLPVLDLAR